MRFLSIFLSVSFSVYALLHLQIHLLEIEESREIKCQAVYSHPGEVWHLSPSPSNAALFFSCFYSLKGSLFVIVSAVS